jgi:hypothetical protein
MGSAINEVVHVYKLRHAFVPHFGEKVRVVNCINVFPFVPDLLCFCRLVSTRRTLVLGFLFLSPLAFFFVGPLSFLFVVFV